MVALSALARSAAEPFSKALNLVLPPRCLSCEAPMEPPGGLCPDCWPKVRFLSDPLCERCGVLLADQTQVICAQCAAEPPVYGQARAAMLYDEGSRDMVLRMKHADALHGVPVMARWMQRAGAGMLAEADWLVPVPLHWTRLFKRRYNQSAELARAIASISGVKALPDGLMRQRKTPSQGGLTRQARQANVAEAFHVPARHSTRIAGAHVIVIDDVMTTGATLDACAEVLLEAGAARVDALCLARVPEGAAVGARLP